MGTFSTLEDRVISLQKNTACEKVMLLNLFNDYVDLLFLITLFFLNIMFPVNVIMLDTYYIKNCAYYLRVFRIKLDFKTKMNQPIFLNILYSYI